MKDIFIGTKNKCCICCANSLDARLLGLSLNRSNKQQAKLHIACIDLLVMLYETRSRLCEGTDRAVVEAEIVWGGISTSHSNWSTQSFCSRCVTDDRLGRGGVLVGVEVDAW